MKNTITDIIYIVCFAIKRRVWDWPDCVCVCISVYQCVYVTIEEEKRDGIEKDIVRHPFYAKLDARQTEFKTQMFKSNQKIGDIFVQK